MKSTSFVLFHKSDRLSIVLELSKSVIKKQECRQHKKEIQKNKDKLVQLRFVQLDRRIVKRDTFNDKNN